MEGTLLSLLQEVEASSSQPTVEPRLIELLSTLVASYVVPATELTKEGETTLKLLRHVLRSAPDTFGHTASCGCVFKLIQRLMALGAGFSARPGERLLEETVLELLELLLHTDNRRWFLFARDLSLLLEDLTSLLQACDGNAGGASAVITAFENSSGHAALSASSPWCRNFCTLPPTWASETQKGVALQLPVSELPGFLQFVMLVHMKALALRPHLAATLLTTATFDSAGAALVYGDLALKEVAFQYISHCLQYAHAAAVPVEEIWASILITLHHLPSAGGPELERCLASCIQQMVVCSRAVSSSLLAGHAASIVATVPKACMHARTSELQEALLHLATDTARSVPSLRSTLLPGLLRALPRLQPPCAPLMAKLLGLLISPTKPHTHLSHRGDSGPLKQNTDTSSLKLLLSTVEESLQPPSGSADREGGGAAEGVDESGMQLKLGSLRVLGLLAFSEGGSELLGPVVGALEQWAKCLQERMTRGAPLGGCHRDFLELLLSVAEQGKGEWRRETRTLPVLKEFLIQVFKHKAAPQPQHKEAESGGGSGAGSVSGAVDPNGLKALAVAALSYFPQAFNGVFLAAINHAAVPVRLAAVRALRRMQLDAHFLPKVLKAIRKLAEDPEEEVRSAVGVELGPLCCRFSRTPSPCDDPQGPEASTAACAFCHAASGELGVYQGGGAPGSARGEEARRAALGELWGVALLLLGPQQVPRVRASSLRSLTALLEHTPRDALPPFDVLDLIELCIDLAQAEATRGAALRALTQCFLLGPPGASPGRSQSPRNSEESAGEEGNERVLQLMAPLRNLLGDDKPVGDAVFALDAAAAIFLGAEHWGKIRLFAYLILVESLKSSKTEIQQAGVARMKEVARRACPDIPDTAAASRHLLRAYRQAFAEYMARRLHKSRHLVDAFAERVLGTSCAAFAKELTPAILPWCLTTIAAASGAPGADSETEPPSTEDDEDSKNAQLVLEDLARLHGQQLPFLLLRFGADALASICQAQVHDSEACQRVLEYLQRQTGKGVESIIGAIFTDLVWSLVWSLGDEGSLKASNRAHKVRSVIQKVAKIAASTNPQLGKQLEVDTTKLLSTLDRLPGLERTLENRRRALLCLGGLAEIVGNELQSYAPKFLALITAGIEDPATRPAALQACLGFTRQLVQSAPDSLHLFAVQIVVALLPCLQISEDASEEASEKAQAGAGGGVAAGSGQREQGRKRKRECQVTEMLLSQMVPAGEGGEEDEEGPDETLLYPHLGPAGEILDLLIVENQAHLRGAIRDMPPLPGLQALEGVNVILAQAKGALGVQERLLLGLQGITHDSMHVRVNAAQQLKANLKEAAREVLAMLSSESPTEQQLVSKLILALLKGCAGGTGVAGVLLRVACAECLGIFGAVDPSRLADVEQAQAPFSLIQEDAQLALVLIATHLSRALRGAASTSAHDAAAFAIQELLKLMDCGPEVLQDQQPNCSRRALYLWAHLDDPVKEIITPFLSSEYRAAEVVPPSGSGAVYRPGMRCSTWVYSWMKLLIAQSQGSLRGVARACRKAVRDDFGTAQFMLPHLALNVLRYGKEDVRRRVREECLAVIGGHSHPGAATGAGTGAGTETVGGEGTGTAGIGEGTAAGTAAGVERGGEAWGGAPGEGGAEREVCLQEVFHLLDCLETWLVEADGVIAAVRSAASGAGSRRPPSSSVLGTPTARSLSLTSSTWSDASLLRSAEAQCRHVHQFLDSIPRALLAKAASECNAHARALLYLEDDIRARCGSFNPASGVPWSGMPPDSLSLLLKVYHGLGDGDGLVGASALRHGAQPPGFRELILVHEASGSWDQALACYEQALQEEGRSRELNQGFLSCLLNVGNLQAVVTHVDGLKARLPQFGADWEALEVEAAWRLGQWDRLADAPEPDTVNLEALVSGASSTLSRRGDKGRGDLFGTRGDEPQELGLLSGAGGNHRLGYHLGKAVKSLHRGSPEDLRQAILSARLAVLQPLEAAAMESYSRAYPSLVHLHVLQTFEELGTLALQPTDRDRDGDGDCQMLGGGGAEGGCLLQERKREALGALKCLWQERLKVTEFTPVVREPILAAQRVMHQDAGAAEGASASWLQLAKTCRKSGHTAIATRAVLQAKALRDPLAAVEEAKLLWGRGASYQALTTLQDMLRACPSDLLGGDDVSMAIWGSVGASSAYGVPPGAPRVGDHLGVGAASLADPARVARSVLLLARWSHATGQRRKAQLQVLFGQVKVLQPAWEKGFFHFAKYLDDLMQDARQRQDDGSPGLAGGMGAGAQQRVRGGASSAANGSGAGSSKPLIEDDKPWWTYLEAAMSHYAQALQFGHRNLFEALPRLLTLWFEFGNRCTPEVLKKAPTALRAENAKVQKVIQDCKMKLPMYIWLTALPQLVSRICHSNPEVRDILRSLLTHILSTHPQQALWSLVAVSKSTVAARKEAACEVINAAKKVAAKRGAKKDVFDRFAQFIEHIIRLSFFGSGSQKVKPLTVSGDFASLKRILPLPVLVPTQRALTVSLPASGSLEHNHDPFPASEAVTIAGMRDEIDVLSSLQRPKKVEFIGSDGHIYPFLCKPKDDLRKDARMMEFTSFLNRVLACHEAARTRRLYIRTFAVLPLTEDCGMVEWVPHTRGLRQILQDLYGAAGLFDKMTLGGVKKAYDSCAAEHVPPGVMLRDHVLPKFPPLFHRWFTKRFREPAAWLRGRHAYANTAAVWSMVGHIVGLGDRHGENLLLDAVSGDIVQVDFSCLFDKGITLQQPEVVPFRLTQNMVDALGVCGYEGAFRKVCEITLTVLRSRRGALMSVLETFLYDPLVEWVKNSRAGVSPSPPQSAGGTETSHPAAKKALSDIDSRLQGIVVGVGAAPSLPLSVEGQANQLILEATSLDNLGRMYIWWMPWF